jgi:hypothetical protein
VGRRRATTPGHAVRLLDESNAHVLGERSVGGRHEVTGRDTAACTVTQHEPAARLLYVPKLHTSRAVWSVDLEHHRGVCPRSTRRAMSFDQAGGRSTEIETKGLHP